MNRLFLIHLFIGFYTLTTAQPYNMVVKSFPKQEGNVTAVAINHDETLIASGSDDKILRLWNVNTGELLQTMPGHYGAINCIKFVKDNNYLFEAADKNIRYWDLAGNMLKSYSGHVTFIWSFDLNPSETQMITGSYEDKFKIWDLKTGKPIRDVEGHKQSVLAVAYSPDGKLIATGSLDMTIKLWNAETFELIHTLNGHSGNIYDLEFSPDNSVLLSASKDKSCKIWDIKTGNQVRTFKLHKEAVMSVSFHPDGKHFLSASIDKTIILWNATDGKDIYIFNNHTGPVNSVRFSKDGTHFVSGAGNKELFYWLINPRIYVDAYFSDKLQEEITGSYLFRPKGENEKSADYKERLAKQESMKTMLYEKYLNQYNLLMKYKSIIPDDSTKINIKIN